MCKKEFGAEDCTEFESATAVILNCIREERDNICEQLFVKKEISALDAIEDLEQLENTIFLVIKRLVTELGDTKEIKGVADMYETISSAVKDFEPADTAVTEVMKEMKMEE